MKKIKGELDFLLEELSRVRHFAKADMARARERLELLKDDPMIAVRTYCPCGKKHENYRAVCSDCGRRYDS